MPVAKYGAVVNTAETVIDYGSITDLVVAFEDYGSVADEFPMLPGLKWDRKRRDIWSTLIHKAASGKEIAANLWAYPLHRWSLSFEFLRAAAAYMEWQQLAGFFSMHRGRLMPFLFRDPLDYTVSDQLIGTGDGETVEFQMVRTFGSMSGYRYTEPIKEIEDPATIYIDDVEQESGWTIGGNGLLTFDSAPADEALITADFSYWFRCRFVEDEAEFNEFMSKFFELQTVEFISIK